MGLVATPEAVKDTFGEARAERAGGIDVVGSNVAPFVDRDGLMPNTPNKGSLLLGSAGVPGVMPINRCVPGKDAAPFRLGQVDLGVIFA